MKDRPVDTFCPVNIRDEHALSNLAEELISSQFWIVADDDIQSRANFHIGFKAESTAHTLHYDLNTELTFCPDRKAVDAFHEAALKAGGRDNGKPGIREIYHPSYYAAFVLDPAG